MSKFHVIKVEEKFLQMAVDALNAFDVKHTIAGYPDAEVILIERYQSRMNSRRISKEGLNSRKTQYDKMHRFAVEMGCKDVTEAIVKCGGHKEFKHKFDNEYRSIVHPKKVS